MATQDDVRRIALGLPEATEDPDFRFLVDGKAFVWLWRERIDPKRARVPNPEVLAVRIGHESEKETLIEMDPAVFFTEPHYNGYPAILVRLPVIATGSARGHADGGVADESAETSARRAADGVIAPDGRG